MADLAVTYWFLGKYMEAEKLEIQVLDARKTILGVEHPHTIKAMVNLAATYQNLGKYTEAETLKTQACELKRRVPGAQTPHTITNMANVQDAQVIQVLDAVSTVPGEENLHSSQVVLNHPVQAVLPNTTINFERKGIYILVILVQPLSCFILRSFSCQTCKDSFNIQIQNSTSIS